jgi:DNA primase catalytic core
MVKDITAWIKEELYPALYPHIPQALPEHSWTQDRRGWKSKTYLDGSPHRDRSDKTKVLKAQPGYIFEEGNPPGKGLVDYVMERDRLPFIDAVRKLSATAGLQLPSLDAKDQEVYRKAQERTGLLEEATSYMSWALLNATGKRPEAVRKYLQEERGYSMEDVEAMGLGYLPSWDQLKNYLVGKGYQEQAVEEALAIGKDERLGDTHTLAIPYRTGSRIQGFAFRTVTGAADKYLNTKGMDRKAGLFNLSPLRGTKDLVVVEGYLDALHATAKGLENVVATAGTSLSREHVEDAVAKGARAVTLCFDPDQAGRKATDQALEVLRSFPSLKAYVAQLTAGAEKLDPDQLIKEQGVDAFRAVVASAISAWRYELDKLLEPFAQGELQDKDVDQLKERAVATANDIADPIDRERFTSAFLDSVVGLGVTKESLDAVVEDLHYQRKRDQEKKAVDSLLRSVGKDLDSGNPGAAIDRLGAGLQDLRAVRGADLLEPYSWSQWQEEMATYKEPLRTGYASLDRIAPIPTGALTLVAGRPSHGKTSLMFNLLLNMAEVYPTRRFLFFSFEERKKKLLVKLLNALLNRSMDHLYHEYSTSSNLYYLSRYLQAKRTDVPEIEAAKAKLESLLSSGRIVIQDHYYTVEDLDAIIRGEVRKPQEVGAVFFDYIQKMKAGRTFTSTVDRLGYISSTLLELAITTDLPLILGAQFNRDAPGLAGAAGPGKGRPSLENLKGSGDLEQDANLVLSVYNEAREKVGTAAPPDQELEISALKNRDGEVNAITKLMLYATLNRVEDVGAW